MKANQNWIVTYFIFHILFGDEDMYVCTVLQSEEVLSLYNQVIGTVITDSIQPPTHPSSSRYNCSSQTSV